MMMDMAGKRLAAAGVLAAAVAASAALWVAQHAPLPSQLREMRQAHAAITTATVAQVRVPVAFPTPRSAAQLPAGLPVTGVVLLVLLLVGTALRQHRAAVPVTARPPRRGRAPPSPGHHSARTRCR
jgi:hypothetical protein